MEKKIILEKKMKREKYNFIKNLILFDYQKTLLKLTMILFIGVIWVIRGSTAPLIVDNSIFRNLFFSDPTGDKTTYNIGISLIAAYIFYLVQVHLPEKKRVKRNLSVFSFAHRHEIYIINQYIVAWQQFFKDEGVCQFHEFEYTLNNNQRGTVNKEFYLETIDELSNCFEQIISSQAFLDSDVAYKEFIIRAKYTIDSCLKYMNDQFPTWSEEILLANDYKEVLAMITQNLKPIQNRLSRIEKYYLKVIEIVPYHGKSETQKLAEKI